MQKAYKAEFICGLIGTILGILSSIFAITFGAPDIGYLPKWGSSGQVIPLVLGIFASLTAMILGFMAVSRLKRNDRSGGVMLTVAGGLSFMTLFLVGIGMSSAAGYDEGLSEVGLAYFLLCMIPSTVLLLIGGLMALLRKRSKPSVKTPSYPQAPVNPAYQPSATGSYPPPNAPGYPYPSYGPYAPPIEQTPAPPQAQQPLPPDN